jgi:uroporphyrin-III C-methyltransferase
MGTVYLIGAGPGDPELLTVRGARLLGQADAVVYDALTNDALLDDAPPEALRIDVGKRSGGRGPDQEEINELLVRLARKSAVVVRLKGGDPCVFGRGGEEALALRAAGVPFEIVPGITAGLGVLAYAGIPVTHRGVSSSVTFVTGHQANGSAADGSGVDWDALAAVGGTVVVYMGLSKIDAVTERLLAGGLSATTPAAVIESGTYDRQRTIVGELGTIADLSRKADAGKPALIVVGEVVRLRSAMAWFEGAAEDFARPGSEVLPLLSVGREVG